MRILITSIVDLTRSAHNRLHEFVRYLSRDHHVTIISIKDWWKAAQVDVDQYNRGFEDVWSRVDLHYFTQLRISPILQELLSLFTLGKLLRKLGEFDVHFNYNTLVSGLYASIGLKRKGVKTVYDLADDLPAMIRTSPQINPLLRPFGGAFARLMLHCNLQVAEKATLTTEALNLPSRHREKYVLLPNGVDTELFCKKDSRQLRKEFGVEDAFVLGYVGVLREWVDLEPVFGAISDLRNRGLNVKLMIVGEEGGMQHNKDLALHYGIFENVIFTGTVPYDLVPKYISLMNVGLVPFKINSVTEGAIPLKIFEYLACEVPAISTPLPGIKLEFADGIFYAAERDEYTNIIHSLETNRQSGKEKGEQGRSKIVESYSWSAITKRLEGLLRRITHE